MSFNFVDAFNRLDGTQIVQKMKECTLLPEDKFFCVDTYNALKKTTEDILNRINNEEEAKNGIIALTHMVYGWMPTVLNSAKPKTGYFKMSENLKKIQKWKALPRDNKGDVDKIVEDTIKKVIVLTKNSNSVVGASKLLHFVNPEVFPIYDSRVYHAIRKLSGDEEKKSEDASTVNDQKKYIHYVKRIHEIKNVFVEEMEKEKIQKLFDEDASDVRKVEVMLFAYGKEKKESSETGE